MKLMSTGFAVIIFINHFFMQVILAGIIWLINHFLGTSITYWIPAVVLLAITLLIIAAQLLLFKGVINQGKKMDEEFEKERERMFKRHI